MDTHKMIRRLCNVGIGILFPCFLAGLIWLMTGSLEMEPTPEQIEKARISAMVFMLVTGVPCIACIYFRIKYRKR